MVYISVIFTQVVMMSMVLCLVKTINCGSYGGYFIGLKTKTINDFDRIPKVEVNVDYLHTQNHLSTEEIMKLTLIRTPSAGSDYVPYWKTQIKFGESILPSNESKIRLNFTMRKLFDLTEY